MDILIFVTLLVVFICITLLYNSLRTVRHESGVIIEHRWGVINTIKYLWSDLKPCNSDVQRILVKEYRREFATRYPGRKDVPCFSICSRVLNVIKSANFSEEYFKDRKDRYRYLYELSLTHFYNETMMEMNKYDMDLYHMCYIRILWFSDEVEAIKTIKLDIPDTNYKKYLTMTNNLMMKYNEVFGRRI